MRFYHELDRYVVVWMYLKSGVQADGEGAQGLQLGNEHAVHGSHSLSYVKITFGEHSRTQQRSTTLHRSKISM